MKILNYKRRGNGFCVDFPGEQLQINFFDKKFIKYNNMIFERLKVLFEKINEIS